MAEQISLILFWRCRVVCTCADDISHFGVQLKPWFQSFHYENGTPVPQIPNLCSVVSVLFPKFRLYSWCISWWGTWTWQAWQTRSVLDAQKALVRRKMVQISFLWYSEPVPLWTWLFLYFLLVCETNWISAVAALGWYLETTFRSWSCVRGYYKRVFVIWGGLSLQVVNFYCSLLVLSELCWSILTGYRETFEMEEQWMIHSRQSL